MRPVHFRVVIEILVQESAQLGIQPTPPGTEPHQRLGLPPDGIGTLNAGFGDERFGRGDYILHLQIDNAADGEEMPPLVWQHTVFMPHPTGGLFPELDAGV
jgi:hypothetical protein